MTSNDLYILLLLLRYISPHGLVVNVSTEISSGYGSILAGVISFIYMS